MSVQWTERNPIMSSRHHQSYAVLVRRLPVSYHVPHIVFVVFIFKHERAHMKMVGVKTFSLLHYIIIAAS